MGNCPGAHFVQAHGVGEERSQAEFIVRAVIVQRPDPVRSCGLEIHLPILTAPRLEGLEDVLGHLGVEVFGCGVVDGALGDIPIVSIINEADPGDIRVHNAVALQEIAVAIGGDDAAVVVGSAEGVVPEDAGSVVAHIAQMVAGVGAALLQLPIEDADGAQVLLVVGPVAQVHGGPGGIPDGRAVAEGLGLGLGVQQGMGLVHSAKVRNGHDLELLGGDGLTLGIRMAAVGNIEAVELVGIAVGTAVQIIAPVHGAALGGEAVNGGIAGDGEGHAAIAVRNAAPVVGNQTGHVCRGPLALHNGHGAEGIALGNRTGGSIEADQAAHIAGGAVEAQGHRGGIGAGGLDDTGIHANQAAHMHGASAVAGNLEAVACGGAVVNNALVIACHSALAQNIQAAADGGAVDIPHTAGRILDAAIGIAGAAHQEQVLHIALGAHIAKEAGIQALGQDVRIAHLEALAVEGRIEGACVAADGCKSGGLLLTVIVGAPLIIGIKVNGPLLQEGIGLVGGIGQQVRQVVAACVDRIILRRIVVAEAVQVPGIPDRDGAGVGRHLFISNHRFGEIGVEPVGFGRNVHAIIIGRIITDLDFGIEALLFPADAVLHQFVGCAVCPNRHRKQVVFCSIFCRDRFDSVIMIGQRVP